MKRGSMPSRQKIANYWTDEDGQERIRQIKESFKIDVTKLLHIEREIAHCWACNKTLRGGSKGYKTRDLGLHRCHIVPHSLGGSTHPSNLLLMCEPCHAVSPDTSEELYFWRWFDRVEDYFQKQMRLLKECLDISNVDIDSVSQLTLEEAKAYVEKAWEALEITTHGPTISQGTRFVILQKATDLMSLDHPLEREEQCILSNY